MTLRYIGSKTRLVDGLMPYIGGYAGRGRFVDAFCGMGSVAASASMLGWPVLLNDHLSYAAIISAARLTARSQVSFVDLGGYGAAIDKLNRLEGRHGFIWSEYSPASLQHSRARIERRYFTEANAARIDSCRSQIFDWSKGGVLSPSEERLLLADLLSAANRVANIAGTYGCFLSHWTAQSQAALMLRTRELRDEGAVVDISVGDVTNVDVSWDDTVYLDPPYTKRQYASYYHLLETIVHGDAPVVEGVAGLRPWQHLASDFCYKRKALSALVDLIEGIGARRVLLSYSNEGHVDLNELTERLVGAGRVSVEPLANIGRYRPNQVASDKASEVSEYLVIVESTSVNSLKSNNATARR